MSMCTWIRKWIAMGLCACLALSLAGCQSGALSDGMTSQAPEISPDTESLESAWQVDGSTLTDEYLLSLVIDLEVGLTSENSFTFSAPDELSADELYLCFLLLSDYDELEENYWDAENEVFIFTSDAVTAQLSKYFKDFRFDITQAGSYDAAVGAIVAPLASGFGGDRYMKVTEKEIDGNTVTFTADFFEDYEMQTDSYQSKTYAIEFYDGGHYYLSAVIV